MNINKINMYNNPQSFKGVKLESYIYRDDIRFPSPNLFIGVEFTDKDAKVARQVCGFKHSDDDKFHLMYGINDKMNSVFALDPEHTARAVDDYNSGKYLNRGFGSSAKDDPRGMWDIQFNNFEKLCEMMQRATSQKGEFLKEPAKAIEFVKQFFNPENFN